MPVQSLLQLCEFFKPGSIPGLFTTNIVIFRAQMVTLKDSSAKNHSL